MYKGSGVDVADENAGSSSPWLTRENRDVPVLVRSHPPRTPSPDKYPLMIRRVDGGKALSSSVRHVYNNAGQHRRAVLTIAGAMGTCNTTCLRCTHC